MTNAGEDSGSRLLRAVEVIAISPEDAMAIADGYVIQSRQRFPSDSEWNHQLRAASKIVGRYSRLAMMVGGATALPGIIPGLGTAVAMGGGATADSLVCMKLQVDMCMGLAAAFKYDITSEDGKHLAFLIAATGSVQRAGVGAGGEDRIQSWSKYAASVSQGWGTTGHQTGVPEGRSHLHKKGGGKGYPIRDRCRRRWGSQLWFDSICGAPG